jgi:plasmid stabilization system protein ParE
VAAKQSLTDIGKYIKKDSPKNAQKVVNQIREKAKQIPKNPEAYHLLHAINSEDKIYRYALCYKYMIVFRVKLYYILIVDIFHSSRNPESLENMKEVDENDGE